MDFPAPIKIKEEKEIENDHIQDYDINNIFDNNFNIEVKVECDEIVIEENDWCIQNVINSEASYRFSVIDFDNLTEYCPQRCLQCDMIFTNSYELIQHNMTHLNVYLRKPSYFQCSACSEIFLLKFKLIQHIKSKHHYSIRKLKQKRISKMDYKCKICDKIFTYRSWYSHLREVHCERKHICEMCGYVFKGPRYLKRHISRIHEKTYKPSAKEKLEHIKCSLCNIVSQSRLALEMHIKNCHAAKSYDCDLCMYTNIFKSLPYLRCHLRRQHKFKAKEYSCDICKKSFKWLQLLNIHMEECH